MLGGDDREEGDWMGRGEGGQLANSINQKIIFHLMLVGCFHVCI